MENNYYVYGIFNTIKEGEFIYGKNNNIVFNHKPIYIGKGIKNRIQQTLRDDKKNNLKSALIKKYSETIVVKKLIINLAENEAYKHEKYYIEQIGKIINKDGPLTNITDGGESFNSIEVLQYNIKGNFIQEYSSVYEAEVQTNTFNISSCCKGKRITSNNFIWRYKKSNNYPKKIDIEYLSTVVHRGNKERPVLQYDMDMKFIKEYSSITEAQNESTCHKSKIVSVCKGNRKHTKRFIWKYKQESLY